MSDKLRGGTTIAGYTAWHRGNMGPGSGLDADTVDGANLASLLQKGTLLTSADDLDTKTDDGLYSWVGSVPTNAPAIINGSTDNQYCIMLVVNDDTQPQQIVWGGHRGQMWLRRNSSGTWNDWTRFYSSYYDVFVESLTAGDGISIDSTDPNNPIITSEAIGGLSWSIISSNTTAVINGGYFVNTSGGAITVTLPSTAAIGDSIAVVDYSGDFGTNNCTIARNGHNIMGLVSDFVADVDNLGVQFVYVDSTQGWRLVLTSDGFGGGGYSYLDKLVNYGNAGTSLTLDSSIYDTHLFTCDQSTLTLTTSNFAIGRTISLVITNGGSSTITWPTGTQWPGGTAPSLSASGTDRIVLQRISSTVIHAQAGGNGFA